MSVTWQRQFTVYVQRGVQESADAAADVLASEYAHVGTWSRMTFVGLTHFGARALQSLRLEKSFGTWAREFRPSYTPTDAGLDRFVDLARPGLIGGAAAKAARDAGPVRRLVTFVVDAAEADAIGDEPVWHDGKVVGWVTSGGFGHCIGKSIAMGYVPAALAQASTGFEIEILGERRGAKLAGEPLYDAARLRMRRG